MEYRFRNSFLLLLGFLLVVFGLIFSASSVFAEFNDEISLIEEREMQGDDALEIKEQLRILLNDLKVTIKDINPAIKTVQIIEISSESFDIRSARVRESLESFFLNDTDLTPITCIACQNLYLNYDGDYFKVRQVVNNKGREDVDAWVKVNIERKNSKQLKLSLGFYAPGQEAPMQTIRKVGSTDDFTSYAVGLSTFKLDGISTLDLSGRAVFAGFDPDIFGVVEFSSYRSNDENNSTVEYEGMLLGFGLQYMLPFRIKNQKYLATYLVSGIGQISQTVQGNDYNGNQTYLKLGLQVYVTQAFSLSYEQITLETKYDAIGEGSNQFGAFVLRAHF